MLTDNLNHIVLTHGDADHVGGLSDFPDAQVHLSAEELAAITPDNPRYDAILFEHGPHWQPYGPTTERWFGLEARRVDLGFSSTAYLIPLVGHTVGHCGVAVQQGNRWILHAGDTYYLRDEIFQADHPMAAMSAAAAVDNAARLVSLNHIKRLLTDYPNQIEVFCTHDPGEFPFANPG